ncbi:tRNA pseudouridine(55) synthase TruB [Clostridium paridis]|uniref:tRNA pseudouridine synthase B n=1 Tax=Clostridium paridis TaxID=2803863 RepID=A0A937K3L0_9CLOT|nr:tRNA pseudouridine(55) synthase TruB [Clostridium paridis]MBL4930884.1 tRNA pseudouridine(55) synthase TruB [Clostridium paridis]
MNGVININKPKGITSFDVVYKIKKISGEKKIGHTGTLDPLATGVLPICLGKSTKLIDYIMSGKKKYRVKFQLGIVTDTYDSEGTILEEHDTSYITKEEVLHVINSFKGDIMQEPPMYSALKQNGVRLYELARKGIEVEREKRPISIFNIENIEIDLPYITMDVSCSKGTYIRSLCYDIGKSLNVGAVMRELTRMASEPFDIKDSVDLESLDLETLLKHMISSEEALSMYESVILEEGYEKLLINGVKLLDPNFTKSFFELDEIYKVYNSKNEFLGIGKGTNQGFKLLKNLME